MKNQTLIAALIVVVVLGLGLYVFTMKESAPAQPAPATQTGVSFDPVQAMYMVEGRQVSLTSNMIFGQPTIGDLNGDGMPDAAMIIVQQPGGSGTFYYVVAALAGSNGTGQGTNAILLGDRIAPQNVSIENGVITVNYADRKPGEPMTNQPSVGVTKQFAVKQGTLVALPPVAGPGERCGGNFTPAPVCGTGYHCAPEPGSHLPFGDVGGICVAN